VEEIFRGQIDIDLSPIGVKQAELLAGYLATATIEAIYSSPLKRSFRTAEIVAAPHKQKVNVEPDLIDLDFGSWQGLTVEAVKGKYAELYATWIAHPEQVRMPSGEGLEDIRKRIIRVIDKVIMKHAGTAIIVGHRVVNKVILCAILALEDSHFWKIRQDTCGLSIISYQYEQFILAKHNDTSFLRPLVSAPQPDF
jgi:probable phosphoglycerate mutase